MQANLSILKDIKEIISVSKDKAIRAVDNERVLMYWHIGKLILDEEQEGKERAVYGDYLIKTLAEQLEPEYGSEFSYRQLNFFRQFYKTFPIVNALRSQFSWTHYRLLIRIENEDKISFYIAENEKYNSGKQSNYFCKRIPIIFAN